MRQCSFSPVPLHNQAQFNPDYHVTLRFATEHRNIQASKQQYLGYRCLYSDYANSRTRENSWLESRQGQEVLLFYKAHKSTPESKQSLV